MTFQIREVTEQDRSDWERLRNLLWPGTPDDHVREVGAFFSKEGFYGASHVFVATTDSHEIVGFLELNIRNVVDGASDANVPYVEGWYVDEHVRNNGVGRLLFETAEQWALNAGYSEIGSDADVDNPGSIEAHKKLGFEETDRKVCFVKTLK